MSEDRVPIFDNELQAGLAVALFVVTAVLLVALFGQRVDGTDPAGSTWCPHPQTLIVTPEGEGRCATP